MSAMTRRRFLQGSSALALASVVGACGSEDGRFGVRRGWRRCRLQWWDHFSSFQKFHAEWATKQSEALGTPVTYTYYEASKAPEALQLANQAKALPDIYSNVRRHPARRVGQGQLGARAQHLERHPGQAAQGPRHRRGHEHRRQALRAAAVQLPSVHRGDLVQHRPLRQSAAGPERPAGHLRRVPRRLSEAEGRRHRSDDPGPRGRRRPGTRRDGRHGPDRRLHGLSGAELHQR